MIFTDQSGFRALHSVLTSLLKCTNDWYLNIDKGKYTAVVYIDLKKAFDTVDHDILLRKLNFCGLKGKELSWFRSYLTDRRQCCKVNGQISATDSITCGVPQGSCLGPLLFLVYINDLPSCLKNSLVSMYADDTSIYYASESVSEINQAVNADLEALKGWLEGNKLSLNVAKTFILLAKLRKYGVDNLEFAWFSSYLTNRKQYCRVNGVSSKTEDIKCGVPQGSCLGPLLFLIYINDLPFSLKKGKVTMYADDTSISYSSKNMEDINQTLSSELGHLKQWQQGNKLSLNVLKTQALVVGSKPNIKKITENVVDTPQFLIGDAQVENVDQTKYLGVIIDKNLNWAEHIKSVRTKVSRGIGFLKYSRKFLPRNTLSKMYRGIVEPHFRYCCSVWGNCGVTRLQTLQKLQTRAARIVTRSNFDSSAKPLIHNLKWPTISDIIRSETATIMYKSLNGLAPEYLSNRFVKNSTRNIRQLRNTETDLMLPLRKTSNGQRGISFRGSKLWNQLDYDIKQAPSLATFKRRLKEH